MSSDSPSVRDHLDESTVDHYASAYRDKREMPPVLVFLDGKTYYLADGAHRCAAVALLGRKGIEAEVRKGSYIEALQYALRANTAHGLPRSNADKRKCIAVALKQWPESSNNHLAKLCDVDDKTVEVVRAELEATKVVAPSKTRTSSDGRSVPSERVTKGAVRKSELELPPEPPSKATTDKNGTEIPKAILPYWNRANEAKVLIESLTEVMNHLKQAERDKDLQYAEVNISAALGDLEKVRTTIGCAIPYAVCTQCGGHPEIQPKGECRLCLGRGMISKFRWDRLVSDEVKKMIASKEKLA